MARTALILGLVWVVLAGACTSSPRTSGEAATLDPCSVLPRSLVETTLPGAVTQVYELAAEDFHTPPPRDSVSCAYETDGRYGQFVLSTQPMKRSEYDAQYVERDPINTHKVASLGEDARYSGCGGLTVYFGGRVLQLGIQFADCDSLRRLVSLAQMALRRLARTR